MMRVITGTARGRRLETLPGEDVTRPTTESVKEALFSMIQFELEDSRVLDLFAGSGQLGIEALSRGASHCTFVENNRQAMQITKNNVAHCRLEDKAKFVMSDAQSFLAMKNNFDIAFLDPPYKQGIIEGCLNKLLPMMSEDGVVICETSRDENLPESISGWYADRVRSYGKTKLTLYRRED
ncbi:MAG: 16S rRNA (guanine(966)-N(2))-methyltransferase RsmD [Eubacteriales bacterium]|nr:16S rRNA (guanine(966)-N(2))-methyltransferase RsmD [Eubacteriales bacterium]